MNPHNQTKRILIVSLFFKPDRRVGAKRFSFLSKILQKEYPELHVLTMAEKNIPQKDSSLSCAGTVHRVGMYPPHPIETSNIFKRAFNRLWIDFLCLVDPYSGWLLPALFKGIKIIKANKLNLIIATGPPFSPMALAFFLSLLTRTKLILDYRDPWTNLNRKYPKRFLEKFNKFLEKRTIGRASAIVFCSRIMMENFRDSLGEYTKAKYHVITNGFHSRDTIEPLSLGNGRKATMVYAGNFYGERKLDLLAKPLSFLLNEGSISKDTFCCHIFGNLRKQDREVITKYGLQEIIIEQPSVPYDIILRYLKAADILFLPSATNASYAIPFKFFDYLSVKRPIFTIAPDDSAMAEMMNQIDCGRLASINSEESILVNLQTMLLENKEYTYFGANEFTWENIGSKYLEIIDTVFAPD